MSKIQTESQQQSPEDRLSGMKSKFEGADEKKEVAQAKKKVAQAEKKVAQDKTAAAENKAASKKNEIAAKDKKLKQKENETAAKENETAEKKQCNEKVSGLVETLKEMKKELQEVPTKNDEEKKAKEKALAKIRVLEKILEEFLTASDEKKKKMLPMIQTIVPQLNEIGRFLKNYGKESGNSDLERLGEEILKVSQNFEKEVMPVLIKLYVFDAPKENQFMREDLAKIWYAEYFLPKMRSAEMTSEKTMKMFIDRLDTQAEVARKNAQSLLNGENVIAKEEDRVLTNLYYTSAQYADSFSKRNDRLKYIPHIA